MFGRTRLTTRSDSPTECMHEHKLSRLLVGRWKAERRFEISEAMGTSSADAALDAVRKGPSFNMVLLDETRVLKFAVLDYSTASSAGFGPHVTWSPAYVKGAGE